MGRQSIACVCWFAAAQALLLLVTSSPATPVTPPDPSAAEQAPTAAPSAPGESPHAAADAPSAPAGAREDGVVQVAMLVYDGGKTAKCFSDHFLATLARQTGIKVQRRFTAVDLSSEQIFQYPLAILTGQQAFELSDAERDRLKSYLSRGGMLLASAGCSNPQWRTSFEREMQRMFPDRELTPLPMSHRLFQTVYKIEKLVAHSQSPQTQLLSLQSGQRLAVVYSPLGLNDTEQAGKGCCCCGGNELREAHLINANILAYALTR